MALLDRLSQNLQDKFRPSFETNNSKQTFDIAQVICLFLTAMDRTGEKTGFWGQLVLWLCRSLMLAGYQCSEHSVPLAIYCDSLSVLQPVGVLPRHFRRITVLVFNAFRLYSG